ncbi:MAG TPA: hypothetical protein VHN36_19760 [Ilumatobacteraceae bacterium]|nr:hypothetical protein [Ilumatobacteraceae bacterium]
MNWEYMMHPLRLDVTVMSPGLSILVTKEGQLAGEIGFGQIHLRHAMRVDDRRSPAARSTRPPWPMTPADRPARQS